ncbi:hypothetical protein GCM10027421_02640 [Microbacterium shaanxiense]
MVDAVDRGEAGGAIARVRVTTIGRDHGDAAPRLAQIDGGSDVLDRHLWTLVSSAAVVENSLQSNATD